MRAVEPLESGSSTVRGTSRSSLSRGSIRVISSMILLRLRVSHPQPAVTRFGREVFTTRPCQNRVKTPAVLIRLPVQLLQSLPFHLQLLECQLCSRVPSPPASITAQRCGDLW
jgi:hypothetical protein